MTMHGESNQMASFTGSCTSMSGEYLDWQREEGIDVRFLAASTGTVTTELLRLCSPGVRDQERPVVGNELLLELERARRIEVLGIVRNDRLRDRLADGVDLRGVSTTLHAEADVDSRERILAGNKNGLIDLEAQDLGPEEADGRAVDVDEPAALLGVRNSSCGLLQQMSTG